MNTLLFLHHSDGSFVSHFYFSLVLLSSIQFLRLFCVFSCVYWEARAQHPTTTTDYHHFSDAVVIPNNNWDLVLLCLAYAVCDGESTSYSTKMMMSYHVYNTKRHRRYYSRVGCVSCAVCGLNIMSCRLVVASSLQKVEKRKKLHRRRCVVCAQCTQCRCQFYVPSSYFIRFDDDDDTHTPSWRNERARVNE